jgi:2-polyprenyl-3-methyl-5-hydroxy-6-metoxy-1,4-benzoquinol methylase
VTARISYGKSEEAWDGYEDFIIEMIEKNKARTVCDIGGGANPLLSADYIHRKGISYYILDISEAELDKAPKTYMRIVKDIASPEFSQPATKFDLVFSKMLAEHVKDGAQFHKNVLTMLTKNGLAVHFFPTIYALPFLVNMLAPEVLLDKLSDLLTPRDRHQHAKFPAYYSWCRGPVRSQLKKYEQLGYEVIEYRGFFGHEGYYNKLRSLKRMHELKTGYLLRRPSPLFTSYAYVVLKRA